MKKRFEFNYHPSYINSKTARNTYFYNSVSVAAIKKLSYIIIIVYIYMTAGLNLEAVNVIKRN